MGNAVFNGQTGHWEEDLEETRPAEKWRFVPDEDEVTILPVDPPKKGNKK